MSLQVRHLYSVARSRQAGACPKSCARVRRWTRFCWNAFQESAGRKTTKKGLTPRLQARQLRTLHKRKTAIALQCRALYKAPLEELPPARAVRPGRPLRHCEGRRRQLVGLGCVLYYGWRSCRTRLAQLRLDLRRASGYLRGALVELAKDHLARCRLQHRGD